MDGRILDSKFSLQMRHRVLDSIQDVVEVFAEVGGEEAEEGDLFQGRRGVVDGHKLG